MEQYLQAPWNTIFGSLLSLLESLKNFGVSYFTQPIYTLIGVVNITPEKVPFDFMNYTPFEFTLTVGLFVWLGIIMWKFVKSIIL